MPQIKINRNKDNSIAPVESEYVIKERARIEAEKKKLADEAERIKIEKAKIEADKAKAIAEAERIAKSNANSENAGKTNTDTKANQKSNTSKGKNKTKRVKSSKRFENINPESNEDYYKNYLIRKRNNKIKNTLFGFSFITLFSVIIILNIYFIFFREVKSTKEIAAEVKQENNISNYPKDGVESYLDTNLYSILSKFTDVSSGSNVSDWKITDIQVDRIITKSDSNANVYFSCKVNTDIGSSVHNFMLPLYFDFSTKAYSPSGDLIICTTKNTNSVDETETSLFDFGKNTQYDKEETKKLSNFLDSFFIILYNNTDKDISTYYDGTDELGDSDFTYVQINSVEYYQESNYIGCNVKINYRVKSAEGLNYDITNYALVVKNGSNYIIKKLF